MKQDIKERWVAALRSGEYGQGHSYLNDNEGHFCCLGVLCDLAVKDGLALSVSGSNFYVVAYYDGNSSYLPESVQEWAGLESPNPVLGPPHGGRSLAMLNDQGVTFAEIADLIEEGL